MCHNCTLERDMAMGRLYKHMTYHIVAGEEMKKILMNRFAPIPFNEDMSKGSYLNEPFSDGFIKERSVVHGVTEDDYISNMNEFLVFLSKVDSSDIVHLYFGDDAVCKANSELLINYLKDKVGSIYFHLMNEYEGIELSVTRIK